MKIRIVIATLGACALMFALPAHAQQSLARAMTVQNCGQQSFPLGTVANPNYAPLTILPGGNLCTNATGGGGGGAAADQTGDSSAAFSNPTGTTKNQHTIALNYGFDTVSSTWLQAYIDASTHAMLFKSVNAGFNATQAGAATSLSNPFFVTQSIGGATPATGTGAANAQTPRVAVSSDSSIGATEADGANVTLGSKNDAASATVGSTAMSIFRQLHLDAIGATFGTVSTSAPSYTPGQTGALSLTPAGGLRVDGSAVTQPVVISTTGAAGSFTPQTATTTASQLIAAAALPRKVLAVKNQSTTATVAICAASVGTTAIGAAGCWDIPPGGYFAPCSPGGFCPSDAFNMISSSGSSSLTLEAN